MLSPSETVTFLFTDIEGSTKLWEAQPEQMRLALARHDALLRQAIENNNGHVFKTVGDAFCAAFATAPDALNAALAAQQALMQEFHHGEHGELQETSAQEAQPPPPPRFSSASPVFPGSPVVSLPLRVRMALHTGTAELRDQDYFGPPLNRVARLLGAAHGGQTLLSDVTHALVCDALPSALTLLGLGEYRLRDLGGASAVFQMLHPDLPADFPALRVSDTPETPHNLPQQITSFIGRGREMAEVRTLLGKTRLLTLAGSGGCGKTRLSLQVAASLLDNYPDGVWLVELAPLADPGLVPQTLAHILNVTEEAGRPLTQTLVNALKDKRALLVLDNCEHLLDACARLVDALLRACPALAVLASSREGLGIGGEQTYRLPALSLPDTRHAHTAQTITQYEAARLFVARASAVQPQFGVTDANAPALASVCQRLDGIPLALELAAARVRSLSLDEINSKLDNRFRLLTGGSRTALPRQQTLRALIDWSYDLLTPQEKTLLRRLSVFAGGWTLDAAEQVGAGASESGESIEEWEALDLLTSLADKSLVLVQTTAETTRYRLLETVRQYARDRLLESGESLAVRARYGDYFLTLAQEIKPKLSGAEQAEWLEVLETEHDNLRQALTLYAEDMAGTEAGEKGLRLGAALLRFWDIRGHLGEGRARLSALLAHPGAQEPTQARADALDGAGVLTYMQGDYAQARILHEQSLSIQRALGNKSGAAYTLASLGNVAYEQGDYVGARALFEQSLNAHRELADNNGIAKSSGGLANVAFMQGDYAAARVLYEQGLAMRRESGDKNRIANALDNLGIVICTQGDYAGGFVLFEQSLSIYRALGDRNGIAYSLANLADAAYEQGDYISARARFEQSLSIQRELGRKNDMAYSLFGLGNVARKEGDYVSARSLYEQSLGLRRGTEEKSSIAASLEAFALLAVQEAQEARGVRLWAAALSLRDVVGSPLKPLERAEQERGTAAARQTLGEEAFALAWTEGCALTMEQAVEYALEAHA